MKPMSFVGGGAGCWAKTGQANAATMAAAMKNLLLLCMRVTLRFSPW
jgi:hypothetical protein